MKLPSPVYEKVKELMDDHHGPWHAARSQSDSTMRGPGTAFPDLKALDQPGAGEQFLRMHRDMIRLFKWILSHTQGHNVVYTPWSVFPDWLLKEFNNVFPATYVEKKNEEILNLVKNGSADDLGNAIESTFVNGRTGNDGLHNNAHKLISNYELGVFGGADGVELDDARMDDLYVSHHNEYFWHLHGWIDEHFANWQRAHGEPVDQSEMMPMHDMEMMAHHLLAVGPSKVRQVLDELEHYIFELPAKRATGTR